MKIKHLLIGLFAVAAAVACKQDEPVETPKLDVDKTAVQVAATAGEASFSVTTNQDWTASPDADWVSVDPATGKGSEKAVTVKVTAEDNTSEEPRTAKITVKAGELTKTVAVTQAGATNTEDTYILVGDAVGGWDVDANGVVLTLTDGYYVAKEVGITANKGMHFTKNSSWEGNVKGLHGLIAPNEIGEVGTNDISLTEGGAFDVYLTEALDKFYFMTPGKTPEEAVEHVEIAVSWGMMGMFVDNEWGTDVPMTYEGEWIVAKGAQFSQLTFKIRGNGNWNDATNIGAAPGSEKGVVNGKISVVTAEYSKANLGADAADIKLNGEAGTYDVYFSFENLEVYVMEQGFKPGEKDPQNPEPVEVTYTVVGTLKDINWDNANPAGLMVKEGDYYVGKNVPFVTAKTLYDGADQIEFKVVEIGTWDGYAHAQKENENYINGEIPVQAGGENIIVKGAEGNYDVYFDKTNLKVWVMEAGYKPGEKEPVVPQPSEPVTEGVIWENDGSVGAAAWAGSPYRFAMEGKDSQNECCAEIPAAVWAGMKIAPFCVNVTPNEGAEWWQIRVLDGWWTVNDESGASDINPQSAGLVNNGDGTYTFQVDLSGNADLLAVLDAQHLLFAGDGFTINKIYFGELEVPAPSYTIDHKQWVFAWSAMGGASCVIDLGVTEPGVAILAYDMGVLDPSYAGIYYPYMMGTYTIAKTDGTSGVVTLSADGQSVEIPYSNATETTVHFESAALLEGENIDCTLATSLIEISTEAAQGLADGEYWIIADGKVATPLTSNYGYLNVVDAVDGKSTAANAFTFTQVEAGLYTIQDSNGKYYYQTGSYNSFNVADEDGMTDDYLWEVYDSGNGEFVIMNLGVAKFMQYDSGYNSFGSYSDERGVLPTLVLAEDPIAEPEPEPTPDGAYTYTFVSGDLKSSEVTLGGVTWTFAMTDTGGSNYIGWDSNNVKGVQIGKKADPATDVTLSTSGITGKIVSIKVNTSGASGTDAKFEVTVGGNAYGSQVSLTTTATDYTFEGAAEGEVVLHWTATTAAIYVKSIEIVTE